MTEAEKLVEEVAMDVCATNRRGYACVCKRDQRSPLTCEGAACQDAVAGARAAISVTLERCARVAETTGVPFGPWQKPEAPDTFDTGSEYAREYIAKHIRSLILP